MHDEVTANGWTPVPADAGRILRGRGYVREPDALGVSDIGFPSGNELVAKVQEHAKTNLPRQTYNHSMRVFYFATAIAEQQFPAYAAKLSSTTLALACLLHDLGTAKRHFSTTRMSFDFFGAVKALELLTELGCEADQAEAVAEAIMRHQDIGHEGTISFLGQLLQLATIYDNVGQHPRVDGFEKLLHETTLEEVNEAYPREGWLGTFAQTVRNEKRLKPWCHSTRIPDFEFQVEGNELMHPYE